MKTLKLLIILLTLTATTALAAKDYGISDKYGRTTGFYRPGNNGSYRFYNQYNSYRGSWQPYGNRYYMQDQYGRQQGSFKYK